MNRYRWRSIIESQYKQDRKNHVYFHRKTYKKIYQIWVRAKRLGLTSASYSSFRMIVGTRMSWGYTPAEMKMNIGQLEKHLKKIAKNRSQEGQYGTKI